MKPLFHSLRGLFAGRPVPASSARRAGLRLEALEDRSLPSTLSGMVYSDANNNGSLVPGDAGVARVTITLTGNNTSLTQTTDANGQYSFANLAPGTYTLTETEPGGYLSGQTSAGILGGFADRNQISGITIVTNSDSGTDYNFGELPAAARGGQGLTLGFWKQSQHFSSWLTYTQNESFNYVFGVSTPGNPSLLTALQTGGGGTAVLGRQAVAALLNAASANVDYLYGVDQVISMVQQAYANGTYTQTANQLEAQNQLEMPNNPTTGTLTGFVNGPSGVESGVVVELSYTNSAGQLTTLYTTTDSNGFYKFAGLQAGSYALTAFAPADETSAGTAGAVNGTTTGTTGSPTIGNITLVTGGVGVNYDFAFSSSSSFNS
jgi:hypothetical protein